MHHPITGPGAGEPAAWLSINSVLGLPFFP